MDQINQNELQLTPEDIEKILKKSCVHLGASWPNQFTGWGRLDAGNAIALIREPYHLTHHGYDKIMPQPSLIQNEPDAVYIGQTVFPGDGLVYDYIVEDKWSFTFTINYTAPSSETVLDRWLNISASSWEAPDYSISNINANSFDVTVYYLIYTWHLLAGGTYVSSLPHWGGNYHFHYSTYNEEIVGIDEEVTDNAWLGKAYPNPAINSIDIPYSIPKYGEAKLTIKNLLGMEVAIVFNGFKNEGTYTERVDVSILRPGIYFYTLVYDNKTYVNKMQVMGD